MSTAQNNGCEFGDVGSGKDTRSTVTCPITPFSYSTSPIDFEIVIRFIFGSDFCGKNQPEFMYSRDANLSNDPIT